MQTYVKSLIVSFLVLLTLSSFSSLKDTFFKANEFIVVLDAGHGGKDPGKPSKYGYKEKDVALNIVLGIGKELAKVPGIKVVYTRKTDKFIGLKQRGAIANKANADLFVSVHCNAWHTSQPYGAETYVLGIHRNQTNFEVAKAENSVIFLEEDYEKNYEGFDPNSPEAAIGLTLAQEEYLDQSILLASLVQDNFTNKLKRKDRGVKQAGFVVLHQTVMPSILVETGFITNMKEGAFLNSKNGQNKLAKSIANAILNYKNNLYQEDEFLMDITQGTSQNEDASSGLEYKDITFKVQIAASTRALEPKSYNFNGLENITRTKSGKLYKYLYGNTSNYTKVKELKAIAENKGYQNCFIVAYKNGHKIGLQEALKSESN